MVDLGRYLESKTDAWSEAVYSASIQNPWFTSGFIESATEKIVGQFLQETALRNWISKYRISDKPTNKNVGIVMAGNIPMVGFHDFLCTFLAGHKQTIRFSSKDRILIPFLLELIRKWDPESTSLIESSEQLKGCDAYIATGGDRTSMLFEQYFGKYPHIIRKNRTSVAILDGNETPEELRALADDVHMYFGLGCRNITKIMVPAEYDFIPLIEAFKSYSNLRDITRYANNYDYQLSLLLLNQTPYMSSEGILLVESNSFFSPISVLHYEFYQDKECLISELNGKDEIQCIVGHGLIPFGEAQCPGLSIYADGVDTMQFLTELSN
jgi:hypothetical protein